MGRGLIVLGLLFSMIGIILVGSNLIITGNVIGISAFAQIGSFLGIFFFVFGILIASSGDALQAYLERKEKEKASPSLQGAEQTAHERRHFFWRGLLSKIGLGVKKKKREDNKYVQETKYTPTFSQRQIYSEEQDRMNQKKMQDRDVENIRKLRNNETSFSEGINPALKKVKKNLDKLEWKPSVRRKDIEEKLEMIADIYEKWKIPFNKEKYQELFDKVGIAGAEKVLEDLNDFVISNKRPVSYRAIGSSVDSAQSWASFGRRGLVNGAHNKILNAMLEKYANETKTVSVSEVFERYDARIVHGIPYHFDNHGIPPQFRNNAFWMEKIRREGSVGNLQLEDFLENIFEHKPDLSTSAINKNSRDRNFFSPYGVIIKEGKIYDAATHDIASQGEERKELVKMRLSGGDGGGNIDERVRRVANSTSLGEHNEVIIGDNYEVGGIYFTEEHHGWDYVSKREGERGYGENLFYHKGTVARLAKQAIERNVPFYKFKSGEGFTEVNPREYLEDKMREGRRKYVDESRKVAQVSRRNSRRKSKALVGA